MSIVVGVIMGKVLIQDARKHASKHCELKQYAENYVHLLCSQKICSELISEFGSNSKNYGKHFLFSPKTFAQLNQGSGEYQLTTYVKPYILDASGNFTWPPFERPAVGHGMFVHKEDIDTIVNYIRKKFPEEEIANDVREVLAHTKKL